MAAKKIKLILVGGFLGSGKTTLLCRLARYFTDKGMRVGIITNDQADNLVDTQIVKVHGFNVREIPGGCFCCKFNDLVDAAKELTKNIKPDVILAEPVGSCTDLVATVIQPLKLYYKKEYGIGPYTTLLDPKRAKDIIISGKVSGFSENVAYVFKKQLEESDIIGVNKIDTLSSLKTRQIIAAIQKRFPRAKVIGMSCRTGKGFEEWIKILESKCKSGLNIPDIDYDLYAKGEAELAWFNFAANLYAKSGFSGDKFLQGLVVNIKNALKKLNIEAAHIKMALATECGNSMIHLTRTNGAVEFSKKEAGISDKARLIINARAHTDPDLLHKIIKSALAEICKKMKINIKEDSIQYFRPGRPVPVHRFADTKNPKTLV